MLRGKKRRFAQISVEFIIVIGMVLLILTPLWLYLSRSMRSEQSDLRISQARTALARIVQSADLVYAQGSPASTTITIYLPPGISNYTFSENETFYTILSDGGSADVLVFTRTPLVGALPISEGMHKLRIRAEEAGSVNVTSVA